MNKRARILRGKTMVEMQNKNYTLQEIGDIYGITRQRVCQIIKKELKKSADSRKAENKIN